MNEHRLSGRSKAFIAANVAIGIAGILLRPIYPKSIFVAMFVMSVSLTVLSASMSWMGFNEWKRQSMSTIQTRLLVAFGLTALGTSLYMMLLTLHSMLN
ncbi:hypothetical protein [Mesorhizobium sp.]|uniref:hypothetical protein n=1 Tax=Mesorhizobium sp. TaxID=1871066 RepID=UPI000FE98B0A|nr:hypothetical protein [Mesorhizobium sp.]RWI13912.1 MAG: hypothetical protein EOQ92_30230 [Mesorhizobium sp.]RWK46429.1 MAG: hypothetical protein EOR47_26400 [Mesorhizobium sp.]RWK92927.1 MAG: hypothetical protein EOR53_25340 [Mesorhizobium sp.]TIP56002.1 MAG: hypothetical protein E5X56_26435 [Mesorhizobium sp.]TIQ26943.1 MAG: hypothetical protein E5X54_23705 [Mesorhizobium sp.]